MCSWNEEPLRLDEQMFPSHMHLINFYNKTGSRDLKYPQSPKRKKRHFTGAGGAVHENVPD